MKHATALSLEIPGLNEDFVQLNEIMIGYILEMYLLMDIDVLMLSWFCFNT